MKMTTMTSELAKNRRLRFLVDVFQKTKCRFICVALVSIVFIFFNSAIVHATSEQWSGEVSGEAVLENISSEEAKNLCLLRAKAQAMEEVAGVKILSETVVRNNIVLYDFINSQSSAWVKRTKDVKWEPITDYRRTPDSSPLPLYRVRLKALVAVDAHRDDGFQLRLTLNRKSYQDGDEMTLSVSAGKDCRIFLFNILEDEKVTVLLPNRFKMDTVVKGGKIYRFPDQEKMGSSRKMKVSVPEGKKRTRESILAIAVIDDINLIGSDFEEAAFAVYPKGTGLFHRLMEKMMDVPPQRRAMTIQHYEVVSK